ncbi:unnamed protein product [Clonostachys solani]|uniref:MOZ protein represents a chromatin-associated acetyltransferase n=1 Tax=Clonostachys solani TaxID=160281 RepID=A0A9N9Z4W3_9HYPO|nr:unnamed protein product [Clonostachys solani]
MAPASRRASSLLGCVPSPRVRPRRGFGCASRLQQAAASSRRGLVTAVTVYSGDQGLRWKSSFAPRHGKAIEPEVGEAAEALLPTAVEQQAVQSKSIVKMEGLEQGATSDEAEIGEGASGEEAHASAGEEASSSGDGQTSSGSGEQTSAAGSEGMSRGPLEAVLKFEELEKTAKQPPAMSPPRYVHHFDTFSLVKHLHEGGYTQPQAIESMKGIRKLLAQNLSVAQESLVSKSDVENESYLFRAACSELGQEIKNNRRLQDEQVRQQRTHLQHEVDILQQSLNQEVSTLNDNIRGMFNDRKMAVRAEQTNAEGAIQQINYKISTSLVSDMKSEIEGVRWILIRRSATGIFFMAMVTLFAIRYATYLHSETQKEKQRRKKEERDRRDRGQTDSSRAADAAAILAAN